MHFEEKGTMDEAIAAYREAIRLKPDDAQSHLGLVRLMGKGKARRRHPGVPRGDPARAENANAQLALGYELAETGNIDEAISRYRTAIKLKPEDDEPPSTSPTHYCNRERTTRASPSIARRFASNPPTPSITSVWPMLFTRWKSWKTRSPSTARPSDSITTTPRPTTTSVPPWMRGKAG